MLLIFFTVNPESGIENTPPIKRYGANDQSILLPDINTRLTNYTSDFQRKVIAIAFYHLLLPIVVPQLLTITSTTDPLIEDAKTANPVNFIHENS